MNKIRVNKIVANISKYIGAMITIYMNIIQPPNTIEQELAYFLAGACVWIPFLPIDFALLLEKIIMKKLDKDL